MINQEIEILGRAIDAHEIHQTIKSRFEVFFLHITIVQKSVKLLHGWDILLLSRKTKRLSDDPVGWGCSLTCLCRENVINHSEEKSVAQVDTLVTLLRFHHDYVENLAIWTWLWLGYWGAQMKFESSLNLLRAKNHVLHQWFIDSKIFKLNIDVEWLSTELATSVKVLRDLFGRWNKIEPDFCDAWVRSPPLWIKVIVKVLLQISVNSVWISKLELAVMK